jgi:hypothetical protein
MGHCGLFPARYNKVIILIRAAKAGTVDGHFSSDHMTVIIDVIKHNLKTTIIVESNKMFSL